MKPLFRVLILSLTLLIVLTGCGHSIDKDLKGAWKIIKEEETGLYMEFSDERLIVREDINDAPETVDYRLTELQEGKFIIDIAEPGTNTYIFFLEGKFEKKDKIKITKAMDAKNQTFDLIRVKDLEKDMAKEKEKQEELVALEEKESAEKKTKEKKKAEKEKAIKEEKATAEREQSKENNTIKDNENVSSENQEVVVKEKKVSNDIRKDNSLKGQYIHEVDRLDKEIINEAMKTYPNDQDIRYGFYGQYYTEWDNLLNEIWGILKDSMPANEFERLKADQIKWIQQKEQGFAEYTDEVASSRAMGSDYLVFETKDRVNYLIENYLK